jgi:hypothetical protein
MRVDKSDMPRGPRKGSGGTQNSRRLKTAAGFGGLGTTSSIIAVIYAPWWIATMIILAVLLCVLVSLVFPQDSLDRLKWWHERCSAKARRRAARQNVQALSQQRDRTTPPR